MIVDPLYFLKFLGAVAPAVDRVCQSSFGNFTKDNGWNIFPNTAVVIGLISTRQANYTFRVSETREM